MKTLKETLTYKNPRVISKFREQYYFDEQEAGQFFQDLLSWLWLAAQAPKDVTIAIYHSMQVVDKMWHTFIIFSRDYSEFCDAYLGKFIHHEPHTRDEAVLEMTPTDLNPNPLETATKSVELFQGFVYDKLGADTLLRWFITYPHVYSPDEIQRRTRHLFSNRGFLELSRLKTLDKASILAELGSSRQIAAWCGGPSCGPMCKECQGGGGKGGGHPE